MNTPNPLVPQGSLERHAKGKSTVRIAILTIVSIHAVFFTGLLMQGCRRDDKAAAKSNDSAAVAPISQSSNSLPPLDASYYSGAGAATQDVAQSSNTLPPTSNNLTAPVVSEPPRAELPPPAPETVAEGKTYKVAKHDTLAKIAKANGVSVGALKNANPTVDPFKLHEGQTLQIPAHTPNPAGTLGLVEPGKSSAAMPSGTGTVHLVKSGETLTKIAKQYGVSVKALRAANDLKVDRLVVNQKLHIPAAHSATAAADGVKHPAVSKLTATNPAQIAPLTVPAAPESAR